MMPKKRKVAQGQMCWVLAAECGCYYQGPSIASLDVDFFLSIVLILVVLFPSLFFLITLIALFSWQVNAIKSRHQIHRETGSADFLGRLWRALKPPFETPVL